VDPDLVLGDVPRTALAGRVALVTGGSRGIGLAAAREMGRRGAVVVLVGRDAGRVEGAAAKLVAEGYEAVGRACDVAFAPAVRRLRESLGPLATVDVLVCSAGVLSDRTSRTLRTSEEEWRRVLGTNLDGVHHVVREFVPGMVERRDGRVVVVSACMGRMSGPGTSGGYAPYRVSKAALNAYTKNLSAELGDGRRGVLVDAVCPGHCRTDMGGPDAPRSAEQGAATAVWLAARPQLEASVTGVLWEDRVVVPW
jgi:NAD(P)-dependent dehydrogenase (short-subunit alcohol dehydrogenase family)